MPICPKDLKPCCDDLCQHGSCLLMPGVEPLEKGPGGCGQLVGVNGGDPYGCDCPPDGDDGCYYCGDPSCGGQCELEPDQP